MKKENNFILLSEKRWHINLFNDLKLAFPNFKWHLINSKNDFNLKNLRFINPVKIFIPHWSHIIHREIFLEYECVLFHMTDLPFGRGGSPLQNLIVNGYKKTKISALKVVEKIDAGDIYLKSELDLSGSAQEIFLRSVPVIFEMIKKIVSKNLIPEKQKGNVVNFKRRTPKDGDLSHLKELNKIYDYIRMLDADGYPNAFIQLGEFIIEFRNVKKQINNKLEANVRIFKK